jgi:hypothetical protein
MKNKRVSGNLVRNASWGLAVIAVAQMYWVRELFVAWILFSLVFGTLAAIVCLYVLLFEGVGAALGWLATQAHAVRIHSQHSAAQSSAERVSKG